MSAVLNSIENDVVGWNFFEKEVVGINSDTENKVVGIKIHRK